MTYKNFNVEKRVIVPTSLYKSKKWKVVFDVCTCENGEIKTKREKCYTVTRKEALFVIQHIRRNGIRVD